MSSNERVENEFYEVAPPQARRITPVKRRLLTRKANRRPHHPAGDQTRPKIDANTENSVRPFIDWENYQSGRRLSKKIGQIGFSPAGREPSYPAAEPGCLDILAAG
jgi:hypothetical protein